MFFLWDSWCFEVSLTKVGLNNFRNRQSLQIHHNSYCTKTMKLYHSASSILLQFN